MLDEMGDLRQPLVTGHRGARGERPENTLAAFAYAIDIGCDGVELDVHLTRDGVPVVAHDPVVRCPNGTRVDIRLTDVTDVLAIPVSEGETIPTLDAVLRLLASSQLYVQIELKGEGVEEPVIEVVKEYGFDRRTIVTSFIHRRVLKTKELLPEVRTGILLSSVPVRLLEVARQAHADNIHLEHRRLSKEIVEEVHRSGKAIVAWGVISDDEQFDRLFRLGVDMIGSDWPQRLLTRRSVYYAD